MKIIPAAVASKFGRQLLHAQKSSPQVLFAGGVAAGVASTVLACRATLKLSDTLTEFEELRDATNHLLAQEGNDYDEKKHAKDQVALRFRTVLAVSKLYAPAAGLAMISVAMLTGSHVTLNRRNASLTAAYASVDKAFEQYRDRVKKELGDEQDLKFRHGTRKVEEVQEGANGTKKTVKVEKVADETPSLYAKFFDEFCQDWKRDPELNRIFLQCQQNYANDLLRARGHLFLNEVYDSLGIPRTKEGQIVGWVLDGKGDGFVDFGIFDNIANPRVKDFVNGREHSILLDFNVDGVVYDKI